MAGLLPSGPHHYGIVVILTLPGSMSTAKMKVIRSPQKYSRCSIKATTGPSGPPQLAFTGTRNEPVATMPWECGRDSDHLPLV